MFDGDGGETHLDGPLLSPVFSSQFPNQKPLIFFPHCQKSFKNSEASLLKFNKNRNIVIKVCAWQYDFQYARWNGNSPRGSITR